MRFLLSLIGILSPFVVAVTQSGCCEGGAASGTDAGRPDSGRIRLDGGVGGDGGPVQDGGATITRGATQGSAIGITRDSTLAFAINRRTGRNAGTTIERFSLDVPAGDMTEKGSIIDPDARQVIIGPDDNSAYTASATRIVRYVMLKDTERRLTPANAYQLMGGEPRGIALSPNGAYLFVAMWTDGTVLMFNASNLSLLTTIDLNAVLRDSQILGEVSNRPGLAHPYAITISDDGDTDDDDEVVYVTEYFSQNRTTGLPTDNSLFDLGRQGVVYHFDVATQTGRIITLAPKNTGFTDSNGAMTGCFPNLLNVATFHSNRVYIAGTCASPRGPTDPVLNPLTGELANPANFKTLLHAAIWVVDVNNEEEATAESVVLSEQYQRLYDSLNTPDDASRRIPLIVSGLEFERGNNVAWVSAYGSDALFRVEWAPTKAFVRVGSENAPFVDLANVSEPGRLPIGLRITEDGRYAVVVNEHSRNISFVDLQADEVLGAADMSVPLPEAAEKSVNDGRRDFVTGTGRWSYQGQSWSSCEGCHPEGLTDGVTWFFQRGPRQTIALDASYSSIAGVQRIFGWTANADETHDFELFTRDLSGGVGAIVHKISASPIASDRIHFNGRIPVPEGTQATSAPHHGLNGAAESMMPGGAADRTSLLADWNDVEEYLRTVKTPRAPSNLNTQLVSAGRMIFQAGNCSACHVNELWTISRRFYTPSQANNDLMTGLLLTTNYTAGNTFPRSVNPATDVTGRSAPLRDNRMAADDQISCAVRAVATFPAEPGPDKVGVSVPSVLVREVRSDMSTLAQGATGYNVPSLLGIAHSAPYFHAGNARTLEELLSQLFAGHHNAYAGPFMSNDPAAVAQLVAFLTSIDERAQLAVPPNVQALGFNPVLCPTNL